MTITRLYGGGDNKSHFEDIEITLEDAGDIGALSEKVEAPRKFLGNIWKRCMIG